MESRFRVAIVGAGPHGLGAAEALTGKWQSQRRLQIGIFDTGGAPGAGPNFHPGENPACLLNIPWGMVSLPPQPGGMRATQEEPNPESYPPRCRLGDVLRQRFKALQADRAGHFVLELHREQVRAIRSAANGYRLEADRSHGPFDEILLTLGQPPSRPDPQIEKWRDHAGATGAWLVSAYPTDRLLAAARHWKGQRIAIRGLGLAALDVVRLLTIGQGGRFDGNGYRPGGEEPERILPFSLDGHPPCPKPASLPIDRNFVPDTGETRRFEAALRAAMAGRAEDAVATICEALLPPVLRILGETGAPVHRAGVQSWLDRERDAPGSQETRPPVEALAESLDEARAKRPPSVGFAVGQVWRKWQETLRAGFDPAQMPPQNAACLVEFDEGLKRYSYGPPVRSAEELLILIRQGVVELRAAEDPQIEAVKGGWHLREGQSEVDVSAIVDAVLPSPEISATTDPLTVSLRESGWLREFSEGLGAAIRADGRLIDCDGKADRPISMLGRLCLGSVIAADSIHACFGPSSDRWADGVISRAARIEARGSSR